MPPFASFFGELERLLGVLYPYRVPISIAALLVGGLLAWQLQRRSVHVAVTRWASTHRVASAVAGAVLLAIAVPLGDYTLSPLWERQVLDEPSPFEAVRATTPAPTSVTPSPAASAPAAAPTQATSTPATSSPPPAAPPVTAAAPSTATPAATPAPSVATPRLLREGTLQGADAFHFGRGRVQLIDTGGGNRVLRFEELSVRNGPDLFVYLTPNAESVSAATNLGALKATEGAFNYEVPPTVDPAALSNAVIWCRQFGVLFASAALTPAP